MSAFWLHFVALTAIVAAMSAVAVVFVCYVAACLRILPREGFPGWRWLWKRP